MRNYHTSYPAKAKSFKKKLSKIFLYRRSLRILVSLTLILNLLIWPAADSIGPRLSALASATLSLTTNSAQGFSRIFDSAVRTAHAASQQETLDDRLARVADIRITPHKFVGYQNQIVSFSAIATDSSGRTVDGVVFSWATSDASIAQVDETGRATFQQPGMAELICRAGAVASTARVLVKSGQRPTQTDEEWQADQDSLPDSQSSTASLLPSLLDSLTPTVHAQIGGGGGGSTGYLSDELWSEPRNFVGSPRNRVTEPSALGPVLPEGSNFNLAVPIINLPGRGIGMNLALYYNSRVWTRRGSTVTFNAVEGWPFAGFSLGFGTILAYGTDSSTKYVLVDQDGTRHYLGTGSGLFSATYQTNDGTHITFVGSKAMGGTLYYSDGTMMEISGANNRLLPTKIYDPQGNYIQIAYKYGVASPLAIDYITDTQGRKVEFQYDASGKLISITAPGFGGTTQNPITRTLVQFDYQARTLSYNFTGLTVENAPTGQAQTLRHIYFPATSTGHLLTYSDYGMIYNVSARRQMTVDGSGVISDGVENANVAFNYPASGSTSLTDAPAFTQRTESPGGAYSYSTSTDTFAQTMTFTINKPDGSALLLTRSTNAASAANGLMVQSEVKKVSTSYAKSVISYANDPGGSPQPQSITVYDDAGAASKVDFDYDQYGNVTTKRDYGFQISGAWQVRRRIRNTYKTDADYIAAYRRSLVTQIELFDARENTNETDDVLIAKTTHVYDDYAATGGMENYTGTPKPPNYSSATMLRGNVTGTTQWIDIASNTTLPTRLKKYDKFGNVIQEQVSCCKQRVYAYKEVDYWASPQEVTKGDPAGVGLTGKLYYDFNTGVPVMQEDPNLGRYGYSYDAALRLTQATYPNSYMETASYNDALMTATFTKTGLGTSTVAYDGLGRAVQATDPNNGQVNTAYNVIGQVESCTNPFTAGGQSGSSTTYQYDALGRLTLVTLPGGNTVQNLYSGSSVTVTDQVGRKIKRETDGLGRLVKVTEQDSSGALTQETTYSYDLLDKLTGVNQGGQTRAFKYDALGRMTYERLPEQSATINDGAGAFWSSKFTYTDFNAVATRTDARGVVTNYSYDGLNRLKTVSYNTYSAPGVAATPTVNYTYDEVSTSPTLGLLLEVKLIDNSTETYKETYGYDTYKRVSSVTRTFDGKSYATSYQYNQTNQRSKITYSSNRVVHINRDTTGRLSSIQSGPNIYSPPDTTYLSGVGYNSAGQITGFTLGNGVQEIYGYDSNRLQMTTQEAKLGATWLMNLTYDYAAQALQNGAGTQAGNTGSLMTISGSIGGQTESASYTYDLQNRLVTSSQTTNGVTANRRFAYDRFGNRTGVWDAVTGGTQIQTVSLQQSGGAPTNRLTSVTASGVTKNYTYDAAGNVTNDGTHTYQYDAEDRVVSVDGGATANYQYDQNSRRIKKAVGVSGVHYVWEGSQVIAEHDAATSGVLGEYIYSGSRLIAREQSGTRRYYLSDRLSERLVLDNSGSIVGRQSHLPFGEEIAASGENEKHHFTSYERDSESGLDYAINRGYVSGVGRFQQADPYRASGYMVDPQSWNRYSYTRNNPVNRIDPLGLEDFWHIWGWDYVSIAGGFGPGIGSGTGGGGYHPPLEDTGVDTGPGGIGVPIGTRYVTRLIEALKSLGKGCKEFFGGQATIDQRISEIDGDITIVSHNTEGMNDPIPGRPTQTFNDYWTRVVNSEGGKPPVAVAVAFNGQAQPYNSIILGPGYFKPKGFVFNLVGKNVTKYQNITLIHEYMHILNNLSDADLAEKWGLGEKGYDVSEEGVSDSISQFLSQDCQPLKN